MGVGGICLLRVRGIPVFQIKKAPAWLQVGVGVFNTPGLRPRLTAGNYTPASQGDADDCSIGASGKLGEAGVPARSAFASSGDFLKRRGPLCGNWGVQPYPCELPLFHTVHTVFWAKARRSGWLAICALRCFLCHVSAGKSRSNKPRQLQVAESNRGYRG